MKGREGRVGRKEGGKKEGGREEGGRGRRKKGKGGRKGGWVCFQYNEGFCSVQGTAERVTDR
jgi:hypothetical protein